MSQWAAANGQYMTQVGFPGKSLWAGEELAEHLLGNALRVTAVGGRGKGMVGQRAMLSCDAVSMAALQEVLKMR